MTRSPAKTAAAKADAVGKATDQAAADQTAADAAQTKDIQEVVGVQPVNVATVNVELAHATRTATGSVTGVSDEPVQVVLGFEPRYVRLLGDRATEWVSGMDSDALAVDRRGFTLPVDALAEKPLHFLAIG